jgi:hypothetical protein
MLLMITGKAGYGRSALETSCRIRDVAARLWRAVPRTMNF